ncbi:hypothetical protein HAX54_039943 [Datura stramonium]|uniref:Uncharacterized protein n=1 Tax=Datura stramonium TaxID=4076 RepID=A0ABS8VM17_DATST|nr:hypothetical protein [Datura stramonium]
MELLDANELASFILFGIDKFQRLSIQAFLRGSSVVVSAPTSSGKTLIEVEAAAIATVARGRRLFYTTPLKRCSVLLIMTTEILRNMLYQSVGIASSDGGLHVDIHGRTELVTSTKRPVPLTWHFPQRQLYYLLDDKGTSTNRKLSFLTTYSMMNPAVNYTGKKGSKRRKSRRQPMFAPFQRMMKHIRRTGTSNYPHAVASKGKDMLHKQFGSSSAGKDVMQLSNILKTAGYWMMKGLRRGVAAHHAGCLPLWKSFIEDLFQRAKGANSGRIQLSSNELFQMAGRAGRRGIDEKGHVVLVQTPFEGPEECCKVLFSGLQPLVSQFTASYGMVLNLVAGAKVTRRSTDLDEIKSHAAGRTLEEARKLIEQSFGRKGHRELNWRKKNGAGKSVLIETFVKGARRWTPSIHVWNNDAFALKAVVENFELGDIGGFPNVISLSLADALPREIMAELLDKAEMQWQKLAVSELGGLWCMEGSFGDMVLEFKRAGFK